MSESPSTPSTRREQAIALRRAGHTRAETARIMGGISARRVGQLTKGADITPVATSAPETALQLALDPEHQAPIADHWRADSAATPSGPAPPVSAPTGEPCEEPGCDFRGNEAAMQRHVEMNHADPAARRRRSRTRAQLKLPKRYAKHAIARGEPVWFVPLADCPAVLGYSGMDRKDGAYEATGGFDSSGRPRSCRAALQFLLDLGDISEPDVATAVTYNASLADGSRARGVCFRRSAARYPGSNMEIFNEPPESDAEVRTLLLHRFDQLRDKCPGYLVNEHTIGVA
jgi:hypothetical protein